MVFTQDVAAVDAGGAASTSAGAWRAYNDSWVRSASAADAVNSEAYVLFYHRRCAWVLSCPVPGNCAAAVAAPIAPISNPCHAGVATPCLMLLYLITVAVCQGCGGAQRCAGEVGRDRAAVPRADGRVKNSSPWMGNAMVGSQRLTTLEGGESAL